MVDPVESTENPVEETENVSKAELARLKDIETKHQAVEGYTNRKLKEQKEEFDAKMAELESKPSGDEDVDTAKQNIVKEKTKLEADKKDIDRDRKKLLEDTLQSLATNLSLKYDIPAEELAPAKTEAEMENIALKAYTKKLEAESNTPENQTVGGGTGGSAGRITVEDARKYDLKGKKAEEVMAEGKEFLDKIFPK